MGRRVRSEQSRSTLGQRSETLKLAGVHGGNARRMPNDALILGDPGVRSFKDIQSSLLEAESEGAERLASLILAGLGCGLRPGCVLARSFMQQLIYREGLPFARRSS